MRLFIILFVALFTLSVSAQDTNSVQPSQPFMSFVKINGQTLQADNYDEYLTLKDLVEKVNDMRRLRSEGRMLKEDYDSKVAILLHEAETNGIISH